MRALEPKSICDQIDCLARLTGAPNTFIAQVKALFEKKGIPLQADAAPYLKALEEAFRREESIRATSMQAQRGLVAGGHDFNKIGQAYVRQAERLRAGNGELLERARRILGGPAPRTKARTRPVTVQGDHRSFVTRAQRDDLPLVPGPTELQ